MNRTKCIEKTQMRIDAEFKNKELIKAIPINKLLDVTIQSWGIDYKNVEDHLVAIVDCFNLNSIRFNVVAVSSPFTYPFSRDVDRPNDEKWHEKVALRFNKILKWELFPESELPILLGWGIQYPLLSELIKGHQ